MAAATTTNIIFLVTLSCLLQPWTSGEVFTAISHLKTLVDVERKLTEYLDKFIANEQERLDRILSVYNASSHLLGLNFTNKIEVEKYVGNPIESYRMLRRLLEFESIEQLIEIDFSKALVQSLQHHRNLFPNEDDFKGAQIALMRLQQTYDLPPATISDGIAPDVPSSTRMSADDTFAIGKEAYLKEDYVECELWMRETLRLLGIGRTQGKAPSRFEVLDYLAFAEQEIGKIESAVNHSKEMLMIDPNNQRIKTNLAIFQETLSNKRTEERIKSSFNKKTDSESRLKAATKRKFPKFYYTNDEDHYQRYLLEKVVAKRLCRGETKPIPKRHKRKLVCWCDSRHPRLKLKPAKVERVYVNPDVLLFRAVLSDNEVQRIKELALPMLNRATVHNPSTGRIEFANYRISKSAWLEDSIDPLIKKIDTKIEAMTNLTMETAESLQIANYGIGGHYDTHFDFSRLTPIRSPPWRRDKEEVTLRGGMDPKASRLVGVNGNRIATFLIYLSDVSMGGGTVFTNLHIEIRPSKGDAVFWYNLHGDGTGDYNTRHAACPVLLGEKWVANKWIHERGQEFTRRCPLDRYANEKE